MSFGQGPSSLWGDPLIQLKPNGLQTQVGMDLRKTEPDCPSIFSVRGLSSPRQEKEMISEDPTLTARVENDVAQCQGLTETGKIQCRGSHFPTRRWWIPSSPPEH